MTKTLMLVDDNKDVLYALKQGLSDLGADYKFLEANSGKECFDLLEKSSAPDAILLDIMMPEMDGWDVAAKLKSDPKTKDVPIIFLTAKTDDLSKGMGAMSAEDYIEKPFDITDVKARIEKVLK